MFFKRRTPAMDAADSFDVRRRIERLQVAALRSTLPGEAAAPLNQAGDLLLGTGDLSGALDLYGRAVDNMIEADRYEAAMGLCRKIIRTVPEVVRARCTLAWLAMGAGFTAELESRLVEYVMAAERSGREAFARKEVLRMSTLVELHEVRILLAEYLLFLGDDRSADALFGQVFHERNTGVTMVMDPQDRWSGVRQALLSTPRAA
jgi:hypothetical protein